MIERLAVQKSIAFSISNTFNGVTIKLQNIHITTASGNRFIMKIVIVEDENFARKRI